MAIHPIGRERSSEGSSRDRKRTQRERLLAGMLHAANREGYAKASIAHTIAYAGVSRPTFYDYFSDKDDCFLAVCEDASRRLASSVAAAVREAPPAQAAQTAACAIVTFAQTEPDQALFLTGEAVGGGSRALERRDHTIQQIESIVRASLARAAGHELAPDLPLNALVGGLHWLLAPHLRRGEPDLRALGEELVICLERYMRPVGAHRWTTLKPGPAPAPSQHVAELALRAPPAIPPGRSKLSAAELASNQRERILFATTEVAAEKGYAAMTIADITHAAKVDRRVFYSHFRDKQQAFLTIHELAFQQSMAVTAGAFFTGGSWPERVWEGLLAFAQFQVNHPALAHMGFVDSYTVGSDAVRRVEDSRTAFTLFLQEGYQSTSDPPPRIAMDAIAAAISEIGYHMVRSGQTELFPRVVAHSAYVALAPFMGAEEASRFVDRKLAEGPQEDNRARSSMKPG